MMKLFLEYGKVVLKAENSSASGLGLKKFQPVQPLIMVIVSRKHYCLKLQAVRFPAVGGLFRYEEIRRSQKKET